MSPENMCVFYSQFLRTNQFITITIQSLRYNIRLKKVQVIDVM